MLPNPALAQPTSHSAGVRKVSSCPKQPNFFIVGAPKCGTTSLDYYFSQHPEIFVARKEMHFFGRDLRFGSHFYRRDRKAYLAEFAEHKDQTCSGECSVWYLFSNQAAAEIKAFNPDARIIIMLREPVAMLDSLYNQFRHDGNEGLPTFEEALAAEADRRAGRRIGRQSYLPQVLDYRGVVRWTEQVQRYFDVFGREQVHVIIYDDFAGDTIGTYRKALDFLGVSPHPVEVDFTALNVNLAVKSKALQSFLQDPLVRGTAIALRNRVPEPVFALVRKMGLRLGELNVKTGQRPSMRPELRARLRREFVPEVERLSALLDRDLTYWSKTEIPDAIAQPDAVL